MSDDKKREAFEELMRIDAELLRDIGAEENQQVEAWQRICRHPFFADCFRSEKPLIDSMIDKLDAVTEKRGLTVNDLKVGDRVRIDFSAEGEIDYVGSAFNLVNVLVEHTIYTVPSSAVTKIGPALPTVEGSVIRITRWCGEAENWTALLTAGGWYISVNEGHPYPPGGLDAAKDWTFEVLYVPEEGA